MHKLNRKNFIENLKNVYKDETDIELLKDVGTVAFYETIDNSNIDTFRLTSISSRNEFDRYMDKLIEYIDKRDNLFVVCENKFLSPAEYLIIQYRVMLDYSNYINEIHIHSLVQ